MHGVQVSKMKLTWTSLVVGWAEKKSSKKGGGS